MQIRQVIFNKITKDNNCIFMDVSRMVNRSISVVRQSFKEGCDYP